MSSQPERVYDQIEIAVPVHIRKRRARRMPPCPADARRGGHVFKLPVAEISIKGVRPGDRAEVNIAPAVAIEIAQRNAGALHEIVVLHDQPVVENVHETDARLRAGQLSEAGFAIRRNLQRRHATTRHRLPAQLGRARHRGDEQHHDGREISEQTRQAPTPRRATCHRSLLACREAT